MDSKNEYLYQDDLYKRFVVSSSADLTDTRNFSHSSGKAYSQSCDHASGLVDNLNELACFYKADLIDFTETFNWLRNQSERLARKTSTGTASVNGTVLTLDGLKKTDSTIYFSLSSWDIDITDSEDSSVRDITISESGDTTAEIGKFRLSIDSATQKITNVSSIDSNDEPTAIEIDNLNTACNFTLGDKSFYFDPESLMVMTISAESISFTNNYGLVFRKVDGSGSPLRGADIQLQEKQSDYVNAEWNWSTDISSLTIDPDSLMQGTIYRFHEETPPSGYETASDIYFMKTGDTTVKYANPEEALSESENILDLTNDDSRTITMTDIQVAGAALTLKKVVMVFR
ncbi:MAG: SpaA isopeptide-forming pilin-related protein [Ruminococcus sp.]